MQLDVRHHEHDVRRISGGPAICAEPGQTNWPHLLLAIAAGYREFPDTFTPPCVCTNRRPCVSDVYSRSDQQGEFDGISNRLSPAFASSFDHLVGAGKQ